VEFLAFLKQVTRAYPRVPLHVVCDNYATHKHPNVTAWLAKNPRVQLHWCAARLPSSKPARPDLLPRWMSSGSL
jgi:hypothetical protein